ncbi:hypothetical protein EV662_1057 [Rhodovulum marinum]|uniref:Uncharacterized protein n=1 Tax=Rhodovulum marinum TaxID=320662 RepID=A0A4R2PYD7_9RHOB|nr:hypothetical protein EV662_1057 [Rhodovulum marinum]
MRAVDRSAETNPPACPGNDPPETGATRRGQRMRDPGIVSHEAQASASHNEARAVTSRAEARSIPGAAPRDPASLGNVTGSLRSGNRHRPRRGATSGAACGPPPASDGNRRARVISRRPPPSGQHGTPSEEAFPGTKPVPRSDAVRHARPRSSFCSVTRAVAPPAGVRPDHGARDPDHAPGVQSSRDQAAALAPPTPAEIVARKGVRASLRDEIVRAEDLRLPGARSRPSRSARPRRRAPHPRSSGSRPSDLPECPGCPHSG